MTVKPPCTVGLSLSVGSASLAMRCFLAILFGVVGALCLAAAVAISHRGPAAAAVVAVLAIVPLGCTAVLAATYTLAPFSRFGLWLDVFAGNLTWTRFAAVLTVFWAIGVLLLIGGSARGARSRRSRGREGGRSNAGF